MEIFFLRRTSTGPNGSPVFENQGLVDSCGIFDPYKLHYLHSKLIRINSNGDLMVPLVDRMAVLRRTNPDATPPEFAFDHIVSSDNVATAGNNFTAIIPRKSTDKRYLLDNCVNNTWALRELIKGIDGIMVSSEAIPITGPDGLPFRVDGVTDPQGGKEFYGFNRAFFWNHDGKSPQDLIVGTDKGLLYRLKTTESGFIPFGPLASPDGHPFKIYNRCSACGIDLTGDGREDLIVGGISYQMGIPEEPVPGGGVFRIMNPGSDESGNPLLGEKQHVVLIGIELNIVVNSHIHVFSLDIDGDGEKEVVISNQGDGFRGFIFKADTKNQYLVYTGDYIKNISIEDNLLDLNDNGQLEIVFAGGETGIAYYSALVSDKDP
jgi:hypothetical protein